MSEAIGAVPSGDAQISSYPSRKCPAGRACHGNTGRFKDAAKRTRHGAVAPLEKRRSLTQPAPRRLVSAWGGHRSGAQLNRELWAKAGTTWHHVTGLGSGRKRSTNQPVQPARTAPFAPRPRRRGLLGGVSPAMSASAIATGCRLGNSRSVAACPPWRKGSCSRSRAADPPAAQGAIHSCSTPINTAMRSSVRCRACRRSRSVSSFSINFAVRAATVAGSRGVKSCMKSSSVFVIFCFHHPAVFAGGR